MLQHLTTQAGQETGRYLAGMYRWSFLNTAETSAVSCLLYELRDLLKILIAKIGARSSAHSFNDCPKIISGPHVFRGCFSVTASTRLLRPLTANCSMSGKGSPQGGGGDTHSQFFLIFRLGPRNYCLAPPPLQK